MGEGNSSAAGAAPELPTAEPVLALTDRLRGTHRLAVNDGAGLLDGKDTFTRKFETPPIQHEAAEVIEGLLTALRHALAEIHNPGAFRYAAQSANGQHDIVEYLDAVIAKATQPAASRGEATPNSTAELGA